MEARARQIQVDRTNAPAFNLFALLDLERSEATHTRFLADLLDPSGNHQQSAPVLALS